MNVLFGINDFTLLCSRKYINHLQSMPPDFYEGDRRLPIFAKIPAGKKRLLSAEDTVRCILHPQFKDAHMCSKTPTYVNHNTMFLVDTTKLGDPTDVESDDLGVWHNNRVDTLHFSVKVDDKEVTEVMKRSRK